MNKRFFIPCLAAVAAIGSCSTPAHKAPIMGTWLQPVPGQKGALQGIVIAENGIAESVNMYTLVYQSWTLKGDQLTLSGTSVGNRQSLPFTTSYTVKKLTPETLELKQGDETQIYFRKQGTSSK